MITRISSEGPDQVDDVNALYVAWSDRAGTLLLLYACKRRHNTLVRRLIRHGVNPQIRNHWHQTLLDVAIQRADSESAQFLLSRGADAQATDGRWKTPFNYVTISKNQQVVQKLLMH